jgi:amidase
MPDADVAFAGVARQPGMVRSGEISQRELVMLHLKRIARLDAKLNAFRAVRAEQALAEADEAQRRRASGEDLPLLGVPLAVKDTQDVAGELTTRGTGAVDQPAREDSEVVRRLRAAGGIVIGKTNLPELAFAVFTESPAWGVTRNPWDPNRVPGGSSGGSAAAVAAGLVPAATGSDGAGSIRIPAAYCSVFGLKPQRGRVPLDPLAEHWYGMTVNGYLTRSVLDTAVLLDMSAGGGIGNQIAPLYLRGIADNARALPHPERLGRQIRQLARLGALYPDAAVRRAKAQIPKYAARVNAIFDDCDVLLTPAMGEPPVPVGKWSSRSGLWTLAGMTPRTGYTPPWNYLGNPAAAVPAGFTTEGCRSRPSSWAGPTTRRDAPHARGADHGRAALGW